MSNLETWQKIIAIVVGLITILTPTVKYLKQKRKEEKDFRKTVLEKLDSLAEDISNCEGELLTQAHEELIKQGYCSADRKQALQARYESYHKKGNNHLKTHYIEEIIALPEQKPN